MPLSAKLSEHFTLGEFVQTSYGHADQQENPPPEVLIYARRLCVDVLEPARLLTGPLQIASGYRCPEVNDLAGGVPGSAHLYGRGADVQPISMYVVDAFNRIVTAAIPFDKAILEHKPGRTWIHLQVPTSGKKPRKEAWMYFPEDGYLKYNVSHPALKQIERP